jgi:transcriptional regulator with XRE-family HTH domain
VGGLSQQALSERSGLHTTHVSGLERGVRNPTYGSLVELAEGLGISVGVPPITQTSPDPITRIPQV